VSDERERGSRDESAAKGLGDLFEPERAEAEALSTRGDAGVYILGFVLARARCDAEQMLLLLLLLLCACARVLTPEGGTHARAVGPRCVVCVLLAVRLGRARLG
jgi:hypothetical protein